MQDHRRHSARMGSHGQAMATSANSTAREATRLYLVARTQADGAHLSGIAAFQAAAPGLKPTYIAGCGALATRHDAMLAGELGADYVLFGEPEREGGRPRFEAVLERVEWWAQVLTI